MKRTLRVGTRGSALATTQTKQFLARLHELHPSLTTERIIIRTTGDIQSERDSQMEPSKGVFVKELEEALLTGRIDLAVHSLKDMPGEIATGLELAAIPERETPCDALISHSLKLSELPPNARVGTGSPRRMALLRNARPDINVTPIRGNIDTRLRKWMNGDFDAIILALAGVRRMSLENHVTETLDPADFIPAPGQGALALEIRKDSSDVRDLLAPLNHRPTFLAVTAERQFQAALGSGCSVPAGAYAHVAHGKIIMHAFLASSSGMSLVRASGEADVIDNAELGSRLERELTKKIQESI